MEQQTPDPANPLQLGPNYADPALEKIRAAARGNGINPDAIKVKSLDGEVAEFIATTSLILRTRTQERVQGGKKQGGEKVDGPQALRDALEKERLRILGSAEIVARIKDMVLERKDKSFGTRNEIIKLPFLTKEYVHYQACKNCNAQGEIKCQRCVGKGYEVCPRCNGQSMEICSQCRGAQLIFNGNAKVPCPKCNGQGRTPCMMCNQTRKIPCSVCRTKGSTVCQTCNGQAWHSYITAAEVDVLATFTFDREAVPKKLLPTLDTRARDIPQFGDITVVFTQTQALEEGQQKSDEIPLKYRVDLPYAEAQIALGKEKTVNIFMLGRSAEIADAPNFLETLLWSGMEILQDAAEGRGNVAQKIHRAGRFRTIRHAIIASAKYSNAKAEKLLMKNTPLGLGEATAKKLIMNADMAMKNITAKPRRNGVVVGCILAGLLFLLYTCTPMRNLVGSMMGGESMRIILDGIMVGLGMLMSIITVQLFGMGAIRKALGKLLPPGQKNTFTAKAGHSGLWSAILCVIFFLMACEASIHTGGSTPEWYAMIRQVLN